jgi:hypothetical protein
MGGAVMTWFRKGPSPYQTALAMIGAKAGDRVLIRGADDAALAAELALVTGLNGRTLVIDTTETRRGIERAAAEAGALLEFQLELGADERDVWDIAVLMRPLSSLDDEGRRVVTRELVDAARPGGRIVVFDGAKRGLFANAAAARLPEQAALDLLAIAGARARRLLAEVDGLAYYEGRK